MGYFTTLSVSNACVMIASPGVSVSVGPSSTPQTIFEEIEAHTIVCREAPSMLPI